LLADAVRRLQTDRGIKLEEAERKSVGLRWQKVSQVSVDLPLPISIPIEYISDTTMRLGLYRRLAELHDIQEVDNLQEEFYDRFGTPSATVTNLLYQLKVKILAEKAGLATIYPESNLIALRFPPMPKEMMSRSFPNFDKDVRIGKNALWLDYQKNPAWQDRLLEILRMLVDQLSPISTHPQ
jgi:transcription-repair coupling factor (superfamily II helicase)